jgi:hypothetical protein
VLAWRRTAPGGGLGVFWEPPKPTLDQTVPLAYTPAFSGQLVVSTTTKIVSPDNWPELKALTSR